MEVSDTASKVINGKQGGKDNDKEDARRGIGEGNKEASVEERKTRTEESCSDDEDELQK